MRILANVIVGIVRSMLGRWRAAAPGLAAVGTFGAVIVSLLGAIILIAIRRAVGIFTQ